MKIAICDDNERELDRLHQLLHEYKERFPSLEIDIDVFSSVDNLRKQPADKYQILLLDILMPRTSGIDFARILRNDGWQAAVIFVTSSPDFALDAYSVNAVQYLLKPLVPELLFQTLDSIIPTIEQRIADSIVVSTPNGIKNLYYHNILFIECVRHLAYFHMIDNTIICSRTLRQSFVNYISPLTADSRFVQPHHSFCINKDYVVKLNPRDFELIGGHVIPIAKDRFVSVKSNYLNYLDNRKEV